MAEIFDYIIVGAGAAGCTLADRLSVDAGARVLLLESGPEYGDDPRLTEPRRWPELLGSEYDWRYVTEPQVYLDGRAVSWPRGRVVGGSTSINAMVYVHGHPSDYEAWIPFGGPGWGFAALEPGLGMLARANGQSTMPRVAARADPHPLSIAFLQAANAVGLPTLADLKSCDQHGVGLYEVTQINGQRMSAAQLHDRAFGRSVPTGLVVQTMAHAARILLRGDRATSVEYVQFGNLRSAVAERDVILCAGTIGSAQLLLLSGIGPVQHLRSLGIDVERPLPGVGQNLHDHIQVSVAYRCAEYLPVAATSNLGEAGGFARTKPDLNVPDIQLSFAPMTRLNDGANLGRGFGIGPAVTRPLSRGRLALRSADHRVPPSIDPTYLAEPADLETLIDGVLIAMDIASARPLSGLRSAGADAAPAARDRRSVARFVRANATTQFHPVGTCRLGTDELGVVDSSLRVHGVTNLRVVDASIMPCIPAGNIQAAVYAIAERAADMIRREHD